MVEQYIPFRFNQYNQVDKPTNGRAVYHIQVQLVQLGRLTNQWQSSMSHLGSITTPSQINRPMVEQYITFRFNKYTQVDKPTNGRAVYHIQVQLVHLGRLTDQWQSSISHLGSISTPRQINRPMVEQYITFRFNQYTQVD